MMRFKTIFIILMLAVVALIAYSVTYNHDLSLTKKSNIISMRFNTLAYYLKLKETDAENLQAAIVNSENRKMLIYARNDHTNPFPELLPDHHYTIYENKSEAPNGILITCDFKYWYHSRDKTIILYWNGEIEQQYK